ncbi:hypothetical protein [uncultured Sphingomonas sp.]|uniref:hypothetical protein n=1 Tax=uncultured Sphingomonas sp. TaxID=158754 RepID=UPI0025F1067F|nr:hypothetical protein [uncultured Sphingomonas sp.]
MIVVGLRTAAATIDCGSADDGTARGIDSAVTAGVCSVASSAFAVELGCVASGRTDDARCSCETRLTVGVGPTLKVTDADGRATAVVSLDCDAEGIDRTRGVGVATCAIVSSATGCGAMGAGGVKDADAAESTNTASMAAGAVGVSDATGAIATGGCAIVVGATATPSVATTGLASFRLRGDASVMSDCASAGVVSIESAAELCRLSGRVAASIVADGVRRPRGFAATGGVVAASAVGAGAPAVSSVSSGIATGVTAAEGVAFAPATIVASATGKVAVATGASTSLSADDSVSLVAATEVVMVASGAEAGSGRTDGSIVKAIGMGATTSSAIAVAIKAATGILGWAAGVCVSRVGTGITIGVTGISPTSAAISAGKALPEAASSGRTVVMSIKGAAEATGGVVAPMPPARSASASAKSLVVVIGEPPARAGLSSGVSDRVVG